MLFHKQSFHKISTTLQYCTFVSWQKGKPGGACEEIWHVPTELSQPALESDLVRVTGPHHNVNSLVVKSANIRTTRKPGTAQRRRACRALGQARA